LLLILIVPTPAHAKMLVYAGLRKRSCTSHTHPTDLSGIRTLDSWINSYRQRRLKENIPWGEKIGLNGGERKRRWQKKIWPRPEKNETVFPIVIVNKMCVDSITKWQMCSRTKYFSENGFLPRWTYEVIRSQAMLGPYKTWRGDTRKYAGCCWKVFPHLVAWVRIIGRGILHVKGYNSTTTASLFHRINAFKPF
jgi:hypothetical protein